jgi:hypothetical protein
MNIVKATKKFEDWLRLHVRIVEPDLRFKHEQMAASLFPFFRATFYRWLQVWPEACSDLDRVPHILSVGDLHVENFGTWRDTDGRLVWGVNDFDEACLFPYTMDLVRLATSAILATREERLAIKAKESAAAILEGYQRGMEEGGRPFVLEESHEWLRAIAESKLRDPVVFWQKLDRLPTVKGDIPESAREAIEHLLPERGHAVSSGAAKGGFGKSRTGTSGGDCGLEGWAGSTGSEGADWIGVAMVASEAHAGGDFVCGDPEASGALSGSLRADAGALDCAAPVAALFAHRTGCARNQPKRVPAAGGDGKRDGKYTRWDGRKAESNPQGFARAQRELAVGSGAGNGGCDGERLASMEGAPAEITSAGALLE